MGVLSYHMPIFSFLFLLLLLKNFALLPQKKKKKKKKETLKNEKPMTMGGAPVVRMLKVPLYHSVPSVESSGSGLFFSNVFSPLPTQPNEDVSTTKEDDLGETKRNSKSLENEKRLVAPPVWVTWIWIQVISYGDRFFWFQITEGAPPSFSSIGPCAMATPPLYASRMAKEDNGEVGRVGRQRTTKITDIPTTLLSGGGVDGGGLGEQYGVDATSTPMGGAEFVGGGLAPPPLTEGSGGGPVPHAAMAAPFFFGTSRHSGLSGTNETALECPEQAFCMSLARRLVYRMSKEEKEKEEEEKRKEKKDTAECTAVEGRRRAVGQKGEEGAQVSAPVQSTSGGLFPEETSTASVDHSDVTSSGKGETESGRRGGGGEVVVMVNVSVSPEKKQLLLSTGVGSGLVMSIEFGNVVYKECLRCIQDPCYGSL